MTTYTPEELGLARELLQHAMTRARLSLDAHKAKSSLSGLQARIEAYRKADRVLSGMATITVAPSPDSRSQFGEQVRLAQKSGTTPMIG